MFFGTMLFLPLLAVLGYVRAAERRRDGRSTLGIWLTTRLCRVLFAVLLHAAVMPIVCVTLAFSMLHIAEYCSCYMCRRMRGVGDQSIQCRAARRALEKTRRKLQKRLRPYRWLSLWLSDLLSGCAEFVQMSSILASKSGAVGGA